MHNKIINVPTSQPVSPEIPSFRGAKKSLQLLLRTQQLKNRYIKQSPSRYSQTSFIESNPQKYKITSKIPFNKSVQFSKHELSYHNTSFIHRQSILKQKYNNNSKLHLNNILRNSLDQSTNTLIIRTNQPKQIQQKQPSYFISDNLPTKMNQYLNLLIHKSDQNYKSKLKEIQEKQQIQKIINYKKKFIQENNYYKKMRNSQFKRKINSKNKFQQQSRRLENYAKSELLKRTQKIINNHAVQMNNFRRGETAIFQINQI